jgi:glycosyltransferase involved in cell wall biosynthesis
MRTVFDGRLSVVIPCHNAATTLASAIKSLLVQYSPGFEVFVVDDGSRDHSLGIARSFEPHIRILAGPHRGASAARNRGIAETRGEWILFLDADDLLMPETLQKRLDVAEGTGADVVICDWQEFTEENGKGFTNGAVRSVDWEALQADSEIACATHVWATTAAILYRRTLVEKIGGFREDLPVIQDARLLFDAAHRRARFAHANHVGARYRVSPGSLSRRSSSGFWSDVLRNGQQIEVLWRARGALSQRQREAVAGIYNHAARGLFSAGDPRYFEAVAAQRAAGERLPLHTRVAAPVARAVGLGAARRLASWLGRT